MTQIINSRRYDIDWLRTLAFGLLILYHLGMYYVADWGWHIKSDHHTDFVWLQDLMILTNPWRMSLLFFISGIALALVAAKYPASKLAMLRTSRLFVPLLFGMFVIVSPQPYYEALDQGLIQPGFWSFWLQYINPWTSLLPEHHSAIGLLTWNHLWFLPYLWCYSMLVIGVKPMLNRLAASPWLVKLNGRWALLAVIFILVIAWYFLRSRFPSSHALVNDWYTHAKYLPVFVGGYLFACQRLWWQQVIIWRYPLLLLAFAGYLFLVLDRHNAFPLLEAQFEQLVAVKLLYGFISAINHWAWILAMVGLAGHFLNRPSRILRYTDKAILPWYMLHQTLIIVSAANLEALELSPGLEALLILLLTCFGCYLGYQIIRRIALLSWLCGLKKTDPAYIRRNSPPHNDEVMSTADSATVD